MSDKKLMDKEAAARIAKATAEKNAGKIPKDSFAAKAQSIADKRIANNKKESQ